MRRGDRQRLVVLLAAALLLAALVRRLDSRGVPWLAVPQTPDDFAAREDPSIRNAIIAFSHAAKLLPRGAQVTALRPADGRASEDWLTFLTAIGQLPHQAVLPPFAAAENLPPENLVEYVVAVDGPLVHPGYREVASFPHGRLYRVIR